MKVDVTTEPPEAELEEEGDDGDEAGIMVSTSIIAPQVSINASVHLPLTADVPAIANALHGAARGAAIAYSPVLGEMVAALAIDTGNATALWLNPEQVAAGPAGLTLTALNRAVEEFRRGTGKMLQALKFHPTGTTVPVDHIRAVLLAAGAV